MDFSEIYLNKVVEYYSKLKFKTMPLLSWDFHLHNIDNLKKENQDLLFLKRFSESKSIDVDLVSEFNNSNLVVIVTNLDLKIEFASFNMFYMNGYQVSEVVGKTPKMFQGPETQANIAASIRKKINNNQKFDYVITNYRKDNSLYKCHIKGYPVYDSKGNVVKYLALEKLVA